MKRRTMPGQLSLFDKRWQARRETWAAPADLFRPEGFAVDLIREREARALIAAHHYSASFPASRLSVGLLHKRGPCASTELAGVAVFSVPMSAAVIPAHCSVPTAAGVELGRFVCLPMVAYNGESWFLRRALAALRSLHPEIRAVLSFADPLERETIEGQLCKPAHFGTIYQASNAAFVGRSRPQWLWVDRAGRTVSARALSKIRAQDRGHAYASAQLIAAGADPRQPGEAPAAWLARILAPPLFRRVRHPGNFAYVFGLDRAALEIARSRALPYPRRAPA